MSQERIERNFEVESPAKLRLSNIRGSVDIQPGDDGYIKVNAVKYLDSGSEKDTEIEIEQDDDGQVIVKTKYDNSISNWFGPNKPCKVEYSVQVPVKTTVKANGVSSSISVQGMEGDFDIHSVSGSLKLNNLTGSIKANSVSGSIVGENLTGPLDGDSVSGKIRVMESQLPEAVVKTVSGKMVLQTPLGDGPYIFKSVSGNVNFIVPDDTGCVAHHKSISGRLKTSLPITKDQRYGSRGLAEIQGGGIEVTHKSVSGSLRIITFENEKIVEQRTTTKPPSQSKDKIEILQKIENGELSVEDALDKLNA
jgi:hypothetical protein